MSSAPLTVAQHYAESERLLRVAETSVVDEIQTSTALLAVGHALLTLSPRKARRVERPARHASSGLPPGLTWGDDNKDGQR
jgi:hypothetical protein